MDSDAQAQHDTESPEGEALESEGVELRLERAPRPKKVRHSQMEIHQGRGPAVALPVPGESLAERVERAFAEATKANLRNTVRALDQLIPQLKDPQDRSRYFQALDLLPDLVAHEGRD